jgi:2-phosphoglycolate phosphatase
VTLAVLFDLDGTLVDTAPDLVRTLNHLLAEEGLAPMPYAVARNEVSNGAPGLLRLGFGQDLAGERLAELRARFLDRYTTDVCVNSRILIDLQTLFATSSFLEPHWGIVTNKPHSLTVPLLERLGIADAPATIVSGDRLPERKPNPAPLALAAAELGVPPQRCVYVGDTVRDVEAGHAAGMRTCAAAYGYVRARDDPHGWGADAVVHHPRELQAALARLSEAAP